MKKNLFVYHHNCLDGFTATWVARKWAIENNKEYALIEGKYGMEFPMEFLDKETSVFFLDFSVRADKMIQICDKAAFVTVLDHHASALQDLIEKIGSNKIQNFDMQHCTILNSGAMIAWKYFFGHLQSNHRIPPTLVYDVEDRDLWKFKIPNSREINEFLFSFPYNFDTWDMLADQLDTLNGMETAINAGAALIRKKEKDVKELIDSSLHSVVIDNYEVPTINCPYFFASETGNELCKRYPKSPFAATYFWDGKDYVFSLRSVGDFDVSKVAFNCGGGGHKNASGFRSNHVMQGKWEG